MAFDISALTPKEQISLIYIGYFDRAPEPSGLNFWQIQLNESLDGIGDGIPGMSLEEIATDFSRQQETRDVYDFFDPGSTVSSGNFVTNIYLNLFGRLPDPDGFNFWKSILDENRLPVGEFILEIIGGAQGTDITILQNKLTVATDWHDTALANGVFIPDAAGVVSASTVLDGVTADPATVGVAQAKTDAFFNTAPVATNEFASTNEDAAINGDVGDNTSDADSDTLTHSVEAGNGASNGNVVMNADGTYTYTPNADFNGTDSFTYTVKDGKGGVDTATVNVTVTAVNDAPVAQTGIVTTTAEDNSVTGSVTSSDVDGGTPNYSVSGNPANGSVTMNPDGTYTYTPNANFNGSDSFDYTVNDGKGGVDTATVNINVTAVNDAPVAASATFTGLEDAAAISGTLTATDVDSGDTQTFTLGSNPSNGNVTLNANGTFDYVPNANFNGTDSFQYIVTDAAGATSIATATVTVTAVDDAPVAADSFAAADEGDAVITGAVSATDIDSASITFAVVGTAPAGLAFNNNGTFSFNPSNPAYNSLAAGQVQTLTVNFTATATGQSDAGVLTITVTGTNDAPVASAVTATGAEDGGAITVTPIAADVDQNDTKAYTIAANPSNGAVVVNANGTFSYTPNANFNGTDTFQYTVADSAGATSTATATVVVTSVNDAPVLANETVTGFEDQAISGQLSATDVDGDTLTYSVATSVTNGSLTFNANGSYTYTPTADFNGSDSFTVLVSDGNGGTDTAVVSISITAVDDVLTVGIDDIAGGTGDDLFLANGQTLNPGDSIDGGAGNDTLFVATTGATALSSFLTSNLENITFTHDSGLTPGLLSVDLSSTSGVNLVTFENSFNDADFRFMEGNNVLLNNLTQSVDTLIDGRNNLLNGGSDQLNLTVRNSQTTTPSTGIIWTDAAYEILNVDTDGANGPVSISQLVSDINTDLGSTAATSALGARTLNIDADDAALTIGDINSTITRSNIDAVMGIENPLSPNINTVNATDSTQSVSFSVKTANGVTTLLGGSASDNIEGSDNNDFINGNGGNDNIAGEGGNDNITGGTGNDWITGQDGNDTIDGGDDADNLYGNAGNDSILGGSGGDVIDTGSSADGAGTEFVDAGTDNDFVSTRGEFLVGRTASDDLDPNNTADTTDDVDQLSGGAGIDVLTVSGSNPAAEQDGLNDVQQFETINLQGGTFDFTIGQNVSPSTTTGFTNAETVFEAEHDARVAAGGADGSTTINGTSSTSIDVDATTLDQAITLIGGNGNDELLGGRGDDIFEGDGTSGIDDGGADNMQGGLGNDTFVTSASELQLNDTIEGDGGNDTILITTDNGRTSGLVGSSGISANIGANVSGIETIKVQDNNSGDEGDLTINFSGFDNVDNVNIFHDGTFGGADNNRVHVDGSDMDAGESLTVNMAGNGFDEDIQVTGGAGNDFVAMGEFLDSGDAIDGGAGFDEVHVTSAAIGDFSGVSNIECIRITGATANEVFNFGPDAAAAFSGQPIVIKIDAGVPNITVNTAAMGINPATQLPYDVRIEENDSSNTITTGGGNDTIVTGLGDDTINGNGGADVVIVSGNELDANDVLNLGAGADTVQMDNSTGTVTAVSNLNTNATVENYVLTDGGNVNGGASETNNNSLTFVQTGAANVVNTLTTININSEALTDDPDTFTVTLDASQQDADFAYNFTAGEENDTMVKRNDGVNNNIDFKGGDGNDNFILNGGDAGSTTKFDGGDEFDTVTLSGGQITDDGFVGMKNIENLDSETGVAVDARLGEEAAKSGLGQITGSELGDDVVSDSQFNSDVTVITNGGDDTFDFSASSGAVTFQASAVNVDANDVLNGGTGADDVIELTADNNTADLSTTTRVEKVSVVENGDANIGITITNNTFTGVADGSITVDASALNDTGVNLPEGALTLNAGGVTSGILDVTGGTGNDDITTGGGNDTIASGDGDDTVNSNNGADAVLLGAGNDVANTGAGADVVDAGTGNDTVDGGLGNDTIDGGANNDLITGGAGLDALTGGTGADDFRYVTVADSRGLTRDTISDFNTLEGDEIVVETALIFAAVNAGNSPVNLGIPQNIGLGSPNTSLGFNFAGNTNSFSDAQGAISLTGKDGKADYVLETSPSNAFGAGISKLWVDVNDDGILNGLDLQIFLKDVTFLQGDELKMIDMLAPTVSSVAMGIAEDRLASTTTVTADAADMTPVTPLQGFMDGSDNDGTPVTYSFTGTSPYGTLTLDANTGEYVFTPTSAAIEALDDGETDAAIFTVTVTDDVGLTATTTLTVNVTGADDQPVLAAVVDGSVTEVFNSTTETTAGLTGTLTATDVDTSDTVTFGVNGSSPTGNPDEVSVTGTYGSLVLNTVTGVYTYTYNDAAVEAVAEGETPADNFVMFATDGDDANVTDTFTVTINGDNDAPVVTLVGTDDATGAVVETNATNLIDNGTLTVNDVDLSNTVSVSVGAPTVVGAGGAIAGEAGFLTITSGPNHAADAGQTNNVAWQFNSGAETYNSLAVNETRTVTYTLTFTDNSATPLTTTQDVVVTITGSNDTPTIDVVGGAGDANSAIVTEAAGSTVLPGASDTVTVTDLDITDELALTVSAARAAMVDSGAQNSVTTTISAGLQADIDAAVFSVAPNPAVAGALTTEQVTWTFTPGAGTQFDELQAGDTLTLEYDIIVNDGNGGTDLETISIVINGTNDLPTITGSTNPADYAESAGNSSAQVLPVATGTITVSDLDVGDALTFAVAAPATAAIDLGGVLTEAGPFPGPNSSDNADSVSSAIAALTAANLVTFDNDTSNGGSTTSNWTYNAAAVAADLDFLREGQTLTLTFVATVNDGLSGPLGAQNLVVTITGTNDEPIITGATNPAAILEVAGDSSAQDIAPVTGTITTADADLGDTLTYSVTGDAVAAYNGGAVPVEDSVDVSALIASVAISFAATTSNGESVDTVWTYDPAAADLDWLRAGDSLTLTFTATVTDSAGAADVGTQDIVITITGTNDDPTVSALVNPANITEDLNASAQVVPVTAGSFDVTDEDLGDTLTFNVTAATPVYSGVNPVPAANAADITTLTALTNLVFTDVAPVLTNGETLTVNFNYSTLGNAVNLDWIDDGETVTITFAVDVFDGTTTVSQNVVVTIDGTNDAPVFSVDAGAGDLASGAATEGAVLATITDTLTYTELDNNDAATINAIGAPTVTGTFLTNGGTVPGAVTTALSTAMAASFASATTPGANSLDWTFTTGGEIYDFLGAGETLVATYTISVQDDNGDATTQDVAITLTGINDAPTVTTGPAVAGTTITFEVTDVDLNDELTYVTAVNGITDVAEGDGAAGAPGVTTITAAAQAVPTSTFIQVTDGTDTVDVATLVQGTINGDTLNTVLAGDGIYFGFGGNDNITGGAGNDIITGGAGSDTIDGGAGTDTIVYNAASESGTSRATADDLSSFVSGSGDLIDLSSIVGAANMNGAIDNDGTFNNYGFFGGDLNISFTNALASANVSMTADATDFVFATLTTTQGLFAAPGPVVENFVFLDTDDDNVVDMAIEVSGIPALSDFTLI